MKKLFKLLKKILLSILILYSYNLIAQSINMIIPINLITISSLVLLGLPSLFGLIAIMYIFY